MRVIWTLMALASFTAIGCRGGGVPWFPAPGTKEAQQRQAVIHDPYPQNDLGTPLPDGRPRDYLYPPAEPVRTRAVTDAMPWLGRGQQ